jgi:hypothetical protein
MMSPKLKAKADETPMLAAWRGPYDGVPRGTA